MAEDSDSLDILEFLRDVRANTDISSSLPLYLADTGNSRSALSETAGAKRAASNTPTTSRLRAMGLLDHSSDAIPSDPQLSIAQVLGDTNVCRLFIDWNAPWLPCLQMDEVCDVHSFASDTIS